MTTHSVPSPDSARPPWTVLLVGGGSGTGKTRLARTIGREVGAAWAEADDFRLVLQRLTEPAHQPALHAFLCDDVWGRPPEELRDQLISVGQVVSHALEIVVANHVATNAPLVLEGDGIVPAFAARRTFADLDVGDRVRAVFIVEPDERVILSTMLARGRGFDEHAEPQQRAQARASWLYGRWLTGDAETHGLPVVSARPWPTLVERVVGLVGRHTS